MIAVTNLKNIDEKREKIAMSISAMGLVNRVGGRFQVSTPSLRGKQTNYEVWRDENGKIRCNCLEFEKTAANDSKFRCEHILAVKFALATQNSELVTKQTKTDEKNSEKLETNTNIQGKNYTMNRYNEKPIVQSKEVEITEKSSNVVPVNFAGTLRSLPQDVDSNLLRKRGDDGDQTENIQALESAKWYAVADILDQNSPDWSYMVKEIRQIGSFATVIAAITIGGITREGLGTGFANSEIGIKKAEHDALKCAAGKFGIVRKLYRNDLELVERGGTVSSQKTISFPENPLARSLSDLITAKQLGMLRSISRESGIDANKECKAILYCNTDELSKRAASSLIEHLQVLQSSQERNVFPMRIAS